MVGGYLEIKTWIIFIPRKVWPIQKGKFMHLKEAIWKIRSNMAILFEDGTDL